MTHRPVISIIGNSVPLLIQPFRRSAEDMTYAEHLRDRGFAVVNAAKQSAMVTDLYTYLEDECIRHFPDFVIIHFGIVEATYRARPRWLQNAFSMNAWNNSVIRRGYNGPITRGLKYVAKKLYRKSLERIIFGLGLQRRWVGPERFRFVLRDVVKRVFADTPTKRVVIIGMPRVAEWVEREAPKTNRSIDEFNQVMRDCATEYPNISFFDAVDFQQRTPTAISPDGIHFTAAGHRLLADRLGEMLNGERTDYTGWQSINQYSGLYAIYERWFKRSTSRPE